MALRTLYLQNWLSINGRDALRGRALYDRFRELSEETLLGHVVWTDEVVQKITDPGLASDVVSYSLLNEFRPNVVFSEGGLFTGDAGEWKLPREVATDFCRSGGVLIVADVGVDELHQKRTHYKEAGLFKAVASYPAHDDSYPVQGIDQTRFWNGPYQILCNPKKMVTDEWLRPIYNDVPEILVGQPVCLATFESLLASCNCDTSRTIRNDIWQDQTLPCPFAAVAQVGAGFAVMIAGQVSSDVWLQGSAHNSRWLTNIATFLVDASKAELTRRRSYRRSPHLLFLSHRSVDKPAVAAVASTIKKLGVNLWLDEEQLIPSQSLTDELSRALGKMTHFVLFWSSNCVDAPWVKRELSSAVALLVEKKVPFLIVALDDTRVPPIVADILRIEAHGRTSEYVGEQLVQAVERLSKNART
jgi:hypothetical protein